MTDLCITCQQNANKLQRAANLPESEKAEILKDNQDHINSAQREREFYRNSCTNSQKTLDNIGGYAILNRTNRNVCSLKATIHYSFDFAQQVHIPSKPMQPGAIYFKTPRKCGLMCGYGWIRYEWVNTTKFPWPVEGLSLGSTIRN